MKLLALFLAAFLSFSTAFAESLSLQDAIVLALNNNPRILKNEKDLSSARADISLKKAAFFPKVSLKSGYSKWGANNPNTSFNSYEAAIGFIQPLYKGGSSTAKLKEARAKLSKAQAEVDEEKESLIFDVIKRYYDLLKSEELIKITEESLEETKEYLAFAEARFNAGSVMESEPLLCGMELLNNRKSLIEARNSRQIAMANLNNLIGRDPDGLLKLSGKLDDEILPHDANQPLLSQVRSDTEAASARLVQAKAGYFKPDIDLIGEYKRLNNNIYYSYDTVWSAGIALKFPIFDGWASKSEIAKAQSELESAQFNEEAIKRKIDLKAQITRLTLAEKQEILPIAIEAVHKAKLNLAIFRKSFELGKIESKDLFEAKNLLTKAEVDYINALYEYNAARAEAERICEE